MRAVRSSKQNEAMCNRMKIQKFPVDGGNKGDRLYKLHGKTTWLVTWLVTRANHVLPLLSCYMLSRGVRVRVNLAPKRSTRWMRAVSLRAEYEYAYSRGPPKVNRIHVFMSKTLKAACIRAFYSHIRPKLNSIRVCVSSPRVFNT